MRNALSHRHHSHPFNTLPRQPIDPATSLHCWATASRGRRPLWPRSDQDRARHKRRRNKPVLAPPRSSISSSPERVARRPTGLGASTTH